MREHLYRGKIKYTCEWILGSLITDNEEAYISDGFPEIELDADYWAGSYGYPPGAEDFHLNNIEEVDAPTVCQSTGMKDRKGEMIFEGDLFKIGAEENIYEVRFCEGCFLAYENDKQVGILGELPTGICLVVGNIYDNPELLKVE